MTCLEMNECASNPCMFNGTCIDEHKGYNCSCLDGYYGSKCEFGNYSLFKIGIVLELFYLSNIF